MISTYYAQITELKNYLIDTDYKLLRELDGGEPMDSETKLKRKEARSKINELEALIAEEQLKIEENGNIED